MTLATYPVSLSSLFDRVEALFKQAELALSKEKFELADHFFQAAHSKDPENLTLSFNEALIWHRYSNIFQSPTVFIKGYKGYKQCFNDDILKIKAMKAACNLKVEQYHATQNISSVYDALKLIARLEKLQGADNEILYLKATLIEFKGSFYKDTCMLYEALKIFTFLYNEKNKAIYAHRIASIYSNMHVLNQDTGLIIKAISYRKIALDLDCDNIDILIALASDYQKLYLITLDESQIEEFHEICNLGSIFNPGEATFYLIWAEGLIDMGIQAGKLQWVKLGIEKSHEALAKAALSQLVDILIARGLAFLGQKLDKLLHIQEAFDKIKDHEDDILNERLLITNCDVLIALGHYFQDPDYFYQATDKLQEALSINNSHRKYWEKTAKTYFEASFIDHSLQTIELSLRMANKTLEFYKTSESLLLKASILLQLAEHKQTDESYETALSSFEEALNFNTQIFQPKLSHLFDYAKVLDLCANLQEDEMLYIKAIEQLTQIMLIDSSFPGLHHQIALTQLHFGELTLNPEIVKKSLLHFKLAFQNTNDDALLVDWAVACLTLADMTQTPHEIVFLQSQASAKLKKALRNGHMQACYFMACLYSIHKDYEKAIELLKQAEKYDVLPPHDDMIQDEWLSALQHNHEFIKMVERQEIRNAGF